MNRMVGGAVVLLLVLPLAGCIGGGSVDKPASDPGSDTPPLEDEAPVGDGSDRSDSSDSSGQAPAAEKVDPEATRWVRKQWGNRSKIKVFEGSVDASELLDQRDMAVDAPTSFGCYECGSEEFSPSEGKTILPGTDRIEARLTWSDPTVDSVAISGWPPGWSGGPPRSPVISPGYGELDEPGNISFDVRPNWTDAPMDTSSAWQFVLAADHQGTHPDLEIDVTLSIVRNASLPEIAPAPDPWDGRNWILLYNNVTERNIFTGVAPGGYVCATPCSLNWSRPARGPVVPPDASKIRTTLRWDPVLSISASMSYRTGDGPTSMERVEQGDGHAVFEAEVPQEQADSPYQLRSDWSLEGTLEGRDQPVGAARGWIFVSSKVLRGNATG